MLNSSMFSTNNLYNLNNKLIIFKKNIYIFSQTKFHILLMGFVKAEKKTSKTTQQLEKSVRFRTEGF